MAAPPKQRLEPRRQGRLGRPIPLQPVPQRRRRKIAGKFALMVLLALAAVAGSLAGFTLVYSVDLPQIADLEHYRPSTITDLYDRKGRLIGEFALQHRVVVGYDDFAPVLRQAVISIEDKSFESHWGVNVFRVAGALWHDLRDQGRVQGASTITMQSARNLFLSSARTPTRKIQEAFLAIQIERTFTKQQIFTLYGNQIYLGHGAYGFEAGAEFYFSKHAKDLTLTEAALLAGLPKGPVAYSPLLYPDKALRRRNLVLSEMESDGVITHQTAEEARNAPLSLHIAQPEASVAPWFQEEVRQELEKRFGSQQVHEAGLKVETTLDLDLQRTANRAVADGLAAYERRHGWKGHMENVLAGGGSLDAYNHPDWTAVARPGDYVHALVTRVQPLEIAARAGSGPIVLLPEDWQWTGQRYAGALVKPGDIIYVHLSDQMAGGARRASLEQDSGAQAALLAIDNSSGDVLAMVGGRDFALSQFNRATQAQRQTGSSFKPYVYTTALEDGAKPSDIIVDAPVNFSGYSPHDYEKNFKGPMTLTYAFADSRNVPAVKLAARVGIRKVIDMAHRFGVTSTIQPYLPVALGAASITLEEQVASYSVFPNDGIRVTPHLIRSVKNADGITLWEDMPAVRQVIDRSTARAMLGMLQAVTRIGTGAAVAQLDHPLGGKTGTTSDFTDAWFLGFSPSVTCGVWVGYDNNQSLGDRETGARAALPIWMTWMKAAIEGKDNEQFLADQDQSPDQSPTEKAEAPTPLKRAALTRAKPPARRPAPPAKAEVAEKPSAHSPPVNAAKSPVFRPREVRPALPHPSPPTPPAGLVKPALPENPGR